MAVQVVSGRRLCGRTVQKFSMKRFTSIHSHLSKGLSTSLDTGRPKLTRTALDEEEIQVSNRLRAFSNVPPKACHDIPRQGCPCGTELPIGSASRNGVVKGRLQSHSGTRHTQGSTSVRDAIWSPEDNNGQKTTLPTDTAREVESRSFRGGRGGNTHMSSAGPMSEAISTLKNRQQEGIAIYSTMFVDLLKRCLKQKDVTATRQVHDCIIQSGMEKNPYVATTLLNAYIRCGRLQDARRVFEGIEKKTVVAWSIMIGGYGKNNQAEDAMEVFSRMLLEGVKPDEFTFLSILKACANALALKWGKEVHENIRNAGLESDVRVGTALLQMYAKCGCITEARQIFEELTNRNIITWNVMIGAYAANGSIDDARLLFDRVEKRDVITWNIMIGAYAESGCGGEAYRLFLQMTREGFTPDAITFMSILNASAKAGALEWVKEVHDHALKAGLESDLRVGNALVHMYAKSGSIDNARMIFDRLKTRDVITWNIMIGAYAESGCGIEARDLFLQMKRDGFEPTAITFVNILTAPESAGALELVKEIHNHVLESELESNLRVGNALVHIYAKCGSVDDARVVFDRMEKRDVITWNTMIRAYAEACCGVEAYQLFLQMKREGFKPDAVTYVSILNSSASAGALEWVREVHSHALKAGLESDLRVGNAFVHMYAKSDRIDDAQLIFDRMEKRDVFTWTMMIGAYAKSRGGVEAYRLFLQMKREGFKPDAFTYASILNASASVGTFEWVKEVHSHARTAGLESDLRVGNALVNIYAKSGGIDNARLVFSRMENRDVVTWNIMIGGLAQHGCGHEALELFRKMKIECVKPDETSFVAVLSACCHAGFLYDGCRLFSAMTQEYGIEPNVVHYTCMVDLLGRAGHLEEAKLFIGKMPVEPAAVTWGALLGACRTYGNVELGELAAEELLKLEPKNASAYVLLSNIYAAAGKWEKVPLVRSMMEERGVRKEAGRTWIEVDDKIHHFIVGDTSHPEAKAIYTELKNLTEKLRAEGYSPDTHLVLRNIAEEDKELAVCSHSEKVAIAYGLMRIPRGKPIRVYKNLRVCSDCHTATKFISKVTGREIIARDANRFHHFKDGVCSCGDYW